MQTNPPVILSPSKDIPSPPFDKLRVTTMDPLHHVMLSPSKHGPFVT